MCCSPQGCKESTKLPPPCDTLMYHSPPEGLGRSIRLTFYSAPWSQHFVHFLDTQAHAQPSAASLPALLPTDAACGVTGQRTSPPKATGRGLSEEKLAPEEGMLREPEQHSKVNGIVLAPKVLSLDAPLVSALLCPPSLCLVAGDPEEDVPVTGCETKEETSPETPTSAVQTPGHRSRQVLGVCYSSTGPQRRQVTAHMPPTAGTTLWTRDVPFPRGSPTTHSPGLLAQGSDAVGYPHPRKQVQASSPIPQSIHMGLLFPGPTGTLCRQNEPQ